MFFQIFIIHEFIRSKGFRGAGLLRRPLPKAEALTEPAGETALTRSCGYKDDAC